MAMPSNNQNSQAPYCNIHGYQAAGNGCDVTTELSHNIS